LREVVTHEVADAARAPDGTETRVAGLVGELKTFTTRQGRIMASMLVEDLSGRIECTVFPDTFESSRAMLGGEDPVVISGRIESREDRGIKLLVAEVRPFDDARRASRPSLHVEVRAEDLSVEWLEAVDQVLSAHPGEAEVYLHIVMPDRSRQASRWRRYRVAYAPDVVAALRERFPSVRTSWAKGAP